MKGQTFLIIDNKKIISGIKFVGEKINSPEQRLIQGATALMTQPFIDLHNKEQDEDTRMMSVARTLAKIIAGTTVGVLVRHYSIKMINALSQYRKVSVAGNGIRLVAVNKLKSFFLPGFKTVSHALSEKAAEQEMNLYRKGMGTLIGTVAGLFTNFMIDAPLTKHLTGVFYKKIKPDDPNAKNGVKSSNGQNHTDLNKTPSLLLKLQKEVNK